MKKLLVNLSAWLAGGLAMLPTPALAQVDLKPIAEGEVDASTIADGILTVVDWLAVIAGAIAVAYLVYGGITYITGGAKGAENAKGIIINAIIGIVIILLAYVIAGSVVGLVRSSF